MRPLTVAEREELGLPEAQYEGRAEVCMSYGDFRESRYDSAHWLIAKCPTRTWSSAEFNGSRNYREYRAIRDGVPGVLVVDSFSPTFGHASNGGATWTPD